MDISENGHKKKGKKEKNGMRKRKKVNHFINFFQNDAFTSYTSLDKKLDNKGNFQNHYDYLKWCSDNGFKTLADIQPSMLFLKNILFDDLSNQYHDKNILMPYYTMISQIRELLYFLYEKNKNNSEFTEDICPGRDYDDSLNSVKTLLKPEQSILANKHYSGFPFYCVDGEGKINVFYDMQGDLINYNIKEIFKNNNNNNAIKLIDINDDYNRTFIKHDGNCVIYCLLMSDSLNYVYKKAFLKFHQKYNNDDHNRKNIPDLAIKAVYAFLQHIQEKYKKDDEDGIFAKYLLTEVAELDECLYKKDINDYNNRNIRDSLLKKGYKMRKAEIKDDIKHKLRGKLDEFISDYIANHDFNVGNAKSSNKCYEKNKPNKKINHSRKHKDLKEKKSSKFLTGPISYNCKFSYNKNEIIRIKLEKTDKDKEISKTLDILNNIQDNTIKATQNKYHIYSEEKIKKILEALLDILANYYENHQKDKGSSAGLSAWINEENFRNSLVDNLNAKNINDTVQWNEYDFNPQNNTKILQLLRFISAEFQRKSHGLTDTISGRKYNGSFGARSFRSALILKKLKNQKEAHQTKPQLSIN